MLHCAALTSQQMTLSLKAGNMRRRWLSRIYKSMFANVLSLELISRREVTYCKVGVAAGPHNASLCCTYISADDSKMICGSAMQPWPFLSHISTQLLIAIILSTVVFKQGAAEWRHESSSETEFSPPHVHYNITSAELWRW